MLMTCGLFKARTAQGREVTLPSERKTSPIALYFYSLLGVGGDFLGPLGLGLSGAAAALAARRSRRSAGSVSSAGEG